MEAETEATHSSPLCFHFLNMLLKHSCTSQRDTVPDKQEHGPHPGTVKRPRATQTHKVNVCTSLCNKEGALRGGLVAAGREINSWLFAKLWSQWLRTEGGQAILQPSSSTTAGRQQFLLHCSMNSSSYLTCTSSTLALLCPSHLRDTDPKNYLFLSVTLKLVCFVHKISTLSTDCVWEAHLSSVSL